MGPGLISTPPMPPKTAKIRVFMYTFGIAEYLWTRNAGLSGPAASNSGTETHQPPILAANN
jgi:hypothetical protein